MKTTILQLEKIIGIVFWIINYDIVSLSSPVNKEQNQPNKISSKSPIVVRKSDSTINEETKEFSSKNNFPIIQSLKSIPAGILEKKQKNLKQLTKENFKHS